MGGGNTLLLIIKVSDLEVLKQILDSSWQILPTDRPEFTILLLQLAGAINIPQLDCNIGCYTEIQFGSREHMLLHATNVFSLSNPVRPSCCYSAIYLARPNLSADMTVDMCHYKARVAKLRSVPPLQEGARMWVSHILQVLTSPRDFGTWSLRSLALLAWTLPLDI